MKRILCFGDSNTYGYKPDGTGRYDYSHRYPGILQGLLGDGYRIIEDGCPGRTTVYEDLYRPGKKGIDSINTCLKLHSSFDYIIIMLGTNDSKTAFNATSKDIANGLEKLILAIKNKIPSKSKILIISPIALGEKVWKQGYDPEFSKKSITVVEGLAYEYKQLADRYKCDFLDASKVAKASSMDFEHLDKTGHKKLAHSVYSVIKNGIEE